MSIGPPNDDHLPLEADDPEDPVGMPLELLERRIEALAADITSYSARWLNLLAEFDRREGWADTGCRSTSDWVAWRCAVNHRTAREQVRVARSLRELALIRAEFEAGRLSYSKVRALCRVAEPGDEATEREMIELASHATASQLERMVRAARRVSREEADESYRESRLDFHWDDETGHLSIHGSLPPDTAALFLQAFEAARLGLFEGRRQDAAERREEIAASVRELDGRGSAEPPADDVAESGNLLPNNVDTFAAVAELALDRPGGGLNGGERHSIMVHVDVETLSTDSPGPELTGDGRCEIDSGPGIAAETARRLACDSSIHAILEQDGRILDVGRRTRSIPPSIRRALISRDGGCRFPGCGRTRFVDAHHIIHWAHGGATSLDNLVLICGHHHRLLHEGGFGLERTADGELKFTSPRGEPIVPAPPPPRGHEYDCTRRFRYGSRYSRLLTGTGERMDFALCTDAMLATIRSRE